MINKIKLLRVTYLPKELEPGILYFSKKYGVAGHLCPCGCGNRIITPLDPTEWHLTVKKRKPTLYPSIGNWQIPCKSHYWIKKGRIEWSYQWSNLEIEEGYQVEEVNRRIYFERQNNKFKWWLILTDLFKRFNLKIF